MYSYRLCAFDNAVPANYSTGVTGTGTPQDLTPPSDVTGLSALRGDSQVALSWTNPVASDFMGVRVVRGIGSSPLTSGLKANWHMNEGSGAAASDSSGNNNTAYLGGSNIARDDFTGNSVPPDSTKWDTFGSGTVTLQGDRLYAATATTGSPQSTGVSS